MTIYLNILIIAIAFNSSPIKSVPRGKPARLETKYLISEWERIYVNAFDARHKNIAGEAFKWIRELDKVESAPEFSNQLIKEPKIKLKFKHLSERAADVSVIFGLLRKPKNFSRSLLDLFLSYECTPRFLVDLAFLKYIIPVHSSVVKNFGYILTNLFLNCIQSYQKDLDIKSSLVRSREDQFTPWLSSGLSLRSLTLDNLDDLLDYVQKYLHETSNIPIIETSNLKNIIGVREKLLDVYIDEIRNPSSYLCELGGSNHEYYSFLKIYFAKMTDSKYNHRPLQPNIQLSCLIDRTDTQEVIDILFEKIYKMDRKFFKWVQYFQDEFEI